MAVNSHLPSRCRYCRHYWLHGRRGGSCQKLGAPVDGHWKACSLADAPFNSTTALETRVPVFSAWPSPLPALGRPSAVAIADASR